MNPLRARAIRRKQQRQAEKHVQGLVAIGRDPIASVERAVREAAGIERLPGETIHHLFGRTCGLSENQVRELLRRAESGEDLLLAEQAVRAGG